MSVVTAHSNITCHLLNYIFKFTKGSYKVFILFIETLTTQSSPLDRRENFISSPNKHSLRNEKLTVTSGM